MARTLRVVADTGYLLCFGAIARGTRLLGQAFDAGVGASPTVLHELSQLPRRSNKSSEVKSAAAAFIGRHSGVLLPIALTPDDEARRNEILGDLAAGRDPQAKATQAEPTDGPTDEEAEANKEEEDIAPQQIQVLEGEDTGEAESITLSERLGLLLLINDNAGAAYARNLGLDIEPAAVSLIRLRESFSARELWAISREMQEKVGDIGAVVTGHLFFTQALPAGTMPLTSAE